MRYFALGLLAAVAVSGCGGAGQSSGSDGRDLSYGPITTRAVGIVGEPVVAAGAYSTVTGVFGANFLNVSVNLVPESQTNEDELINSTLLSYSYRGQTIIHDYATGNEATLDAEIEPTVTTAPSFSGNGTQIVTSEWDTSTSALQLFTMNVDGSSRVKITTAAASAVTPSWSPTASKIAFERGSDIYTVNTNGTGLLQLTSTADFDFYPRYSPDGTKIGFIRSIGGFHHFMEMPAAGGAATDRGILFGFNQFQSWDWTGSPDEIIADDNNLSTGLTSFNVVTGVTTPVYYDTNTCISLAVSPTGSHVAALQDMGSYYRIIVIRKRDGAVVSSRTVPTGSRSLEWGPLIRKRSFIAAANGVYHTNAAGFLYGTSSSDFTSFLAFDAVTRNTVDIDLQPVGGFSPANFVATITAADSINMLRYSNALLLPRVTVVDPANAATWVQGAIVTYNANTGKVFSVLPFMRSRSGEKPSRTSENGRLTFRGEFVGIWDADGKKAEGATEVVLDEKSGKIISTR